MDPKNFIRKGIKKISSPIAKKVYNVADNASNINNQPLINEINALRAEIDYLKQKNNNLEEEVNNFKDNFENDLESDIQYIYYYHGGAGNHGCEALVKTITKICNINRDQLAIYSYRPEQDRQFGILDYAKYIKKSNLNTKEMLKYYRANTLAFSIGGDNYCGYPIPQLATYNRKFHEAGVKTALIGCSIEPENLKHGEILGDLCQFDLITARESITYSALIDSGLTKNTHLIPDSAFLLKPEPSGITLPKNAVGLNISSIISDAAGESLIMTNTIELIKYILDNTVYNIALIPHVHQDFNDDYSSLKTIYEHFNKDPRLTLIGTNFNANQLKDIVGQCSMLIAARTHCSIAGYSMLVPTLVLGYSVKSRGIAKDIFGTYENYVQPVQALKGNQDFIKAFKWLDANKTKIRTHLQKTMPSYSRKANSIKKYTDQLKTSSSKTYYYLQPKEAKPGKYHKGKLSIITSCYNSEKYLYRYFNSILNQTNHNIELIIVNDGSTDNTEKIILDYKPIFEKYGISLVYLKQQNGGIGSAYNLAIKYITGEFFSWCDSDNFYAPNYVETVLDYLKNNPNVKCLRHDGYFVPEKDCDRQDIFERTDFEKFSKTSPNPYQKNLLLNSIFEKNWFFGNIVISTAAFDSISKRSIYPSRNGQNWQLCLPILNSYPAFFIPDTLFYFAIRQNSESHQNANNNTALFKQYDEYHQILRKVIENLDIPDKEKILKATEQKYISIKLDIAKNTNDTKETKKYQQEFNEKVRPNNLYQKILKKL